MKYCRKRADPVHVSEGAYSRRFSPPQPNDIKYHVDGKKREKVEEMARKRGDVM